MSQILHEVLAISHCLQLALVAFDSWCADSGRRRCTRMSPSHSHIDAFDKRPAQKMGSTTETIHLLVLKSMSCSTQAEEMISLW